MADKSNALSREEREEFLSEPHIAALSVDSGEEGRAPLTLPIWYQYEPGGELWVMTGTTSRKGVLLTKAGRFSLMVDRMVPTVRYVSVEGPIVSVEPATLAELEEITRRYLPPERVAAYVESAVAVFGEQSVFRMRPQRWLTADLGS
ncbi:pyridoxamine 5'-phosphate oxidase family protein [Streptomyces qinzhouensis]|uniref:Pyridoxamine 5'-phosphate oxidase family protein n=1 Tax=Streptomyces qinzhouensis TaxID=2599401 RepID=A0A5B8JF36_9ACTN|nr:pyridoxamine 5'-phosphate oxidase family protein [Streptomyces qinzhouensis]QDY76053.1 pyridoxamine 5'-phosphate oxidase family protein [Streptomyces qinzhouensis]